MLALLGCLLNTVQIAMYSLAVHVYPTSIRATGIGWALATGRSGGVFSSYTGEWALATGGSAAFFGLIAAAMATVYGALAMVRRHIPRSLAYSALRIFELPCRRVDRGAGDRRDHSTFSGPLTNPTRPAACSPSHNQEHVPPLTASGRRGSWRGPYDSNTYCRDRNIRVRVFRLSRKTALAQAPTPEGWVVLPVEEYRALRERAGPEAPVAATAPLDATLTRVDYELRVDGDAVTGRALLTIDVLRDGWTRVRSPLV